MRTLIAALLVTATVWAQVPKTAPQQGPPPKNLTVRPDGHVSANQDPANPDKFEVYLVKKGDTLSGIAGVVLKNPRFWPQLWEQNEHIINPHWIYPDDKILIQPIIPITEAKPPEPEPPPPPPPPAPEPTRRPPPVPPSPPTPPAAPAQAILILDPPKPVSQIKFSDLYCSGTVRTTAVPEALKVISKADTGGGLLASETEYVYLSQGSENGIVVGNMYQVVRPTKSISSPNGRTKAERDLGTHYLDIGQLRVVLTQPNFSLARVINTCADGVDPGDILTPFQRIAVAEPARPRPFSPQMTTTSEVRGIIVSTKDVMLNFGSSFKASMQIPGVRGGLLGPLERGIASEGTIVYIDIGQNKSVQPGDLFIAYRYVEIDQRLSGLPVEVSRLENARTAIGELVVVKVGERAATALVTYSTDALSLGDAVERR